MSFTNLQQGALITRDTYMALMELKKLVDGAAEKIRMAERETVAVTIGHRQGDDPLKTLQDVAETLQSGNFEAAVALAREKTLGAITWHLTLHEEEK